MAITAQPLIFYCAVPTLSAVITASGQPNEGQSYSLTCEVRGDERLAPTRQRFRWDKVGESSNISRVATFTFNPLRRDDAGVYRCTSTFFSPYLTGSRTLTRTIVVTVNREYNDGKKILPAIAIHTYVPTYIIIII